MSDLIERLRSLACDGVLHANLRTRNHPVCAEAADHIAQLEAENASLKALQADNGELLTIAYLDGSHQSTQAHRAKIAQLEADLAAAENARELTRLIAGTDFAGISMDDRWMLAIEWRKLARQIHPPLDRIAG